MLRFLMASQPFWRCEGDMRSDLAIVAVMVASMSCVGCLFLCVEVASTFRQKTACVVAAVVVPLLFVYWWHVVALLLPIFALWSIASVLRSLWYNEWVPVGQPAPVRGTDPEVPSELMTASEPEGRGTELESEVSS